MSLDLDALKAALAAYPRREWFLDEHPDADEAGRTGDTYVTGDICAPSTQQEIEGGADDVHEIGSLYPPAASRLAVEAVNALPALIAEVERLTRLTQPLREDELLKDLP